MSNSTSGAAFTVIAEATPNPQSMRFSISSAISSESRSFESIEETQFSPLANKIFGFPWAAGVHIGNNFVTITKQDWVGWDILAEPLCGLIQEHLERGEAVLLPNSEIANSVDANDSDVVKKIKAVLDKEIRPQVAMDGGDVSYHKFEDGVVYVYMLGACSGCPSSNYTLKMGIEARLKAAIPEVKEVVSL